MFGVIKGCGCNFSQAERQAWVSHVCGLCLTLRDNYGQLSRLTTNYDAALLSVLTEAQMTHPLERKDHLCPIRGRGFQRAEVVTATQPGTTYAASMAVLMAATKVEDHLADGDGWWQYAPSFLNRWPGRWTQRARQGMDRLGFQAEAITTHTARQAAVEQQDSTDFLAYSHPTELAVGAAFRHTAVIATLPTNAAPLDQLGQMFGRIMYLLDSYRDYAADIVQHKFNALARCFAEADSQAEAQRIFEQAHAELIAAFHQLALPRPALARKLLIQQLRRIGRQTLSGHSSGCALPSIGTPPDEDYDLTPPKKRRPARADIHGGGSWRDGGSCGGWEGCCDCCACLGRGNRGNPDSQGGCGCDCCFDCGDHCCGCSDSCCGCCDGSGDCCCGDGCCCEGCDGCDCPGCGN